MIALATALVSFAVAAGAVFLLVPKGGHHESGPSPGPVDTPAATRPSATEEPSVSPTASSRPAPTPSVKMVGALPPACATVSPGTVGRLIPGAQQRNSSNQTLTTCTYSSGSGDFRWLRVEAHLYPPGVGEPLDDAKRNFAADYDQAHKPAVERTVTLAKQSGLGDEAYRWFKVDKGQPTVVGQITMRVRNALITVSYSEQAESKNAADSREQSCLAKANEVAREVLGSFR
jgi:hypothetical protein